MTQIYGDFVHNERQLDGKLSSLITVLVLLTGMGWFIENYRSKFVKQD